MIWSAVQGNLVVPMKWHEDLGEMVVSDDMQSLSKPFGSLSLTDRSESSSSGSRSYQRGHFPSNITWSSSRHVLSPPATPIKEKRAIEALPVEVAVVHVSGECGMRGGSGEAL